MPYALRLIGLALLVSWGWWQWQANDAPALATTAPAAKPTGVAAPVELPARPLRLKLKATGCQQHCAEFDFDALQFPSAPALTDALLQGLEAPAGKSPEQRVLSLANDFLKEASEFHGAWQQIVKAQQLPGLRTVVVLDVDNYSYTGGAHGMNVVSALNWDTQAQRVVGLSDWLLPKQDAAFWREAKAAHQLWLSQQPEAKSLADGWPFDKTDVMALMPMGLVLKYQPYSIGPYSMGTPEIMIPYARLAGIFKPEYLPLP